MTDEKQFGVPIAEDANIFSADDLLRLQKEHDDLSEIEFATCSVCSHTCGSTSVFV